MEQDNIGSNPECINLDSTLNEISREIKPGQTLVFEIDGSCPEQSDKIYDTLVMRGYDVRRHHKKDKNQIIVNVKK